MKWFAMKSSLSREILEKAETPKMELARTTSRQEWVVDEEARR